MHHNIFVLQQDTTGGGKDKRTAIVAETLGIPLCLISEGASTVLQVMLLHIELLDTLTKSLQ